MRQHKNGLPLETAARYLRGAVCAVSYLHENNIIHRDIKASNKQPHQHNISRSFCVVRGINLSRRSGDSTRISKFAADVSLFFSAHFWDDFGFPREASCCSSLKKSLSMGLYFYWGGGLRLRLEAAGYIRVNQLQIVVEKLTHTSGSRNFWWHLITQATHEFLKRSLFLWSTFISEKNNPAEAGGRGYLETTPSSLCSGVFDRNGVNTKNENKKIHRKVKGAVRAEVRGEIVTFCGEKKHSSRERPHPISWYFDILIISLALLLTMTVATEIPLPLHIPILPPLYPDGFNAPHRTAPHGCNQHYIHLTALCWMRLS